MSRRKKGYGYLGTIVIVPLVFPFSLISFLINYALHYKPTPIVGGRIGRKKKKWL